jgi:protein TonB
MARSAAGPGMTPRPAPAPQDPSPGGKPDPKFGVTLGQMPLAILLAVAVHALALFGIGFKVPDARPPEPSIVEVISVAPSGRTGLAPLQNAPLPRIDHAGETAVPLPDIAPGTEPGTTTARDEIGSATLDDEPADPSPEPDPMAAGLETIPTPPSPTLLRPSREAISELMTGLSPNIALRNAPSLAPPPASAPRASAADVFASRGAEIAALTERIGERQRKISGSGRRKAIDTSTREYRYASYMEAWRRKVERIGNLNYPKEARELGLFGSLILHVAVRADGSLEAVHRPARCALRTLSGRHRRGNRRPRHHQGLAVPAQQPAGLGRLTPGPRLAALWRK